MSGALQDDRIRHLEMLQGVIARMAGTAASIKSLGLMIAAAALAFLATSPEPRIALAAAGLMLVFWLLDARYLQQEKWFRDMFDLERSFDPAAPASFVMTPSAEIRGRTSIRYGLSSWSTWAVYGSLIVFLLILASVMTASSSAAARACPHG